MGDDHHSLGIPAMAAAVVTCALLARPAEGQEALDLQVGSWARPGPDPTLYTAGLRGPLVGPVDVAARAFGLVDTGPSGRSLYGLGPEITVPLGQGRISPYVVAGTGLALETGESTGVAAVWNAGAGLELRPLSWLGVHAEGRRFVEDREAGGFWGLQGDDRRGWQLSAGISVRWGGGARGPADPGPGGVRSPGDVRVDADAASVRAGVVETALEAMGEPYRWGGDSSDDGFDCSGLVWYSYAAHGIDVPRVSRRQARVGRRVSPELSALRPADILLFGDAPGRVTHVGLYVGEARFIHSTGSGGVNVSSLDPDADAYEGWWARRWVGARRVAGR